MPLISLERKRAEELITWEWQDEEPILQVLIQMVPPGKALRKYERIKARQRTHQEEFRRRNPTARVGVERPLTQEQQIIVGARAIARMVIANMVRDSGIVEEREEDGIRYVRRTERRTQRNDELLDAFRAGIVSTGILLPIGATGWVEERFERWLKDRSASD